jgi:hypothetical protein
VGAKYSKDKHNMLEVKSGEGIGADGQSLEEMEVKCEKVISPSIIDDISYG